jgi:hypothetical protein
MYGVVHLNMPQVLRPLYVLAYHSCLVFLIYINYAVILASKIHQEKIIIGHMCTGISHLDPICYFMYCQI